MKINPPWDEDAVKNLNAYQQSGAIHPFTCANRSEPGHADHGERDTGILVATPSGWECRDCDYRQDWALDFMAKFLTSCDVCGKEPMVGVAAMPGVPMSCAYGRECLEANAHPYGIVLANTVMIGGLDQAADWWKEIVRATLAHLDISNEKWEADLTEELARFEEDERKMEEERGSG